jgi:ABC-type uncharacterized transport system permease subunit
MTALAPGSLLFPAALAYLVSAVFYGAGMVRATEEPNRRLLAAGLGAAIIGAILHTGAIGARCVLTHVTPFVTAPDTLSAVGWAIVLILLALQLCPVRDRMIALEAIGMPLAFLCVFAGSAMQQALPARATSNARILNDNLVNLHVVAIVFAFGLIALAFICAALYIAEDRMLKRKSVARLFAWRLPPLTTVDTLAFSLIALAFPLLTIGILAGIVRAIAGRQVVASWGLEPHTLASLVTWAVFGAYLWLHSGMNWRGPKANYLIALGVVAALGTYFAPSTLHRFG